MPVTQKTKNTKTANAKPKKTSGAKDNGTKNTPSGTSSGTSTQAQPKMKAPKRMSALDAAARVLATSDQPMRCTELIAEMQKRELWKSPGGKTPEATLHAAITREIATKGDAARFKKVDRGVFGPGKGV
ncbi:MAG: winged helix-turn-helix domain-containing protein [Phycisphaerae bacterium]|jgi:hypothetical protein